MNKISTQLCGLKVTLQTTANYKGEIVIMQWKIEKTV